MMLLHPIEFVPFANDLSEINRMAQKDPARLVQRSDQRFHKSIADVARRVIVRGARVVLLAGPSSSGKTTTAHLLSDSLRALGHATEMISLDDFYLPEEQAPLREDGQRDFECLEALNVACIRRCLKDLLTNNSCEAPVFDFVRHRPSEQCRHLSLPPDGVTVIEGLHALNPALTSELSQDGVRGVMRGYISVKQDVRNHGEPVLSAHEVRIIRRIVRDFNFRGTSPEHTLAMWDSVMEGEQKYIRPFRSSADFTLNSLHAYELGVLRNPALLLLRGVNVQTGWVADEAQRLTFALMLCSAVPPALLPADSLIREFIGGGLYT